jgi:hypothetical protein
LEYIYFASHLPWGVNANATFFFICSSFDKLANMSDAHGGEGGGFQGLGFFVVVGAALVAAWLFARMHNADTTPTTPPSVTETTREIPEQNVETSSNETTLIQEESAGSSGRVSESTTYYLDETGTITNITEN